MAASDSTKSAQLSSAPEPTASPAASATIIAAPISLKTSGSISLANVRLAPGTDLLRTEQAIVAISVRKPKKQDWIRVFADPSAANRRWCMEAGGRVMSAVGKRPR